MEVPAVVKGPALLALGPAFQHRWPPNPTGPGGAGQRWGPGPFPGTPSPSRAPQALQALPGTPSPPGPSQAPRALPGHPEPSRLWEQLECRAGTAVVGHHQPFQRCRFIWGKANSQVLWAPSLPCWQRQRFLKPSDTTHPSYKCLTCGSFTNETRVRSLLLFIVWFSSTLQHSKILETAM